MCYAGCNDLCMGWAKKNVKAYGVVCRCEECGLWSGMSYTHSAIRCGKQSVFYSGTTS